MKSHGRVANFQKLKKLLKLFIQFSGKGRKFLDAITGQISIYLFLGNRTRILLKIFRE